VFNVLNGGKALGSKVKFSRLYLILDVTPEDEVDPMEVYLKIQAQIRKQVAAHKLGENGFKPGPDGSYFNALENNNETFKFIEDAIAAVQVNVRSPSSLIFIADRQEEDTEAWSEPGHRELISPRPGQVRLGRPKEPLRR
jgi:enolase